MGWLAEDEQEFLSLSESLLSGGLDRRIVCGGAAGTVARPYFRVFHRPIGRDRWENMGSLRSWGDDEYDDEEESIVEWWKEEGKDKETENDMFVLGFAKKTDDNRRIYKFLVIQ